MGLAFASSPAQELTYNHMENYSMNFNVGDKVVCINFSGFRAKTLLAPEVEYTVESIITAHLGPPKLLLKEVKGLLGSTHWTWASKRFAKAHPEPLYLELFE